MGIVGSYRSPSFDHAQVVDAMHPGVVTCGRDTPLRAVAQIMAEKHIHSVIVTDLGEPGGERSWGVVSDVDLLRATAGDIESRTAGEIAASELPTVASSEALARAAQLMAEHEVTHLIVVNAGLPVGVLSTLDVAGVLAWGQA